LLYEFLFLLPYLFKITELLGLFLGLLHLLALAVPAFLGCDLFLLLVLHGLQLVEVAHDLHLSLLAPAHSDLEVFTVEVDLLIALKIYVLFQLFLLGVFVLQLLFL